MRRTDLDNRDFATQQPSRHQVVALQRVARIEVQLRFIDRQRLQLEQKMEPLLRQFWTFSYVADGLPVPSTSELQRLVRVYLKATAGSWLQRRSAGQRGPRRRRRSSRR